jgi:mono/diheme cytochrome c family protein
MSRVALAAALAAMITAPALAQDVGDPVIGKRIADAQCADCHASGLLPGRAPTFSAIARMPSTTATALTVYMRTSHPAMPNIILTPAEQDDVIAYILSLKN